MNINFYLNTENIEDEETRNSFVDFIAETEDVPRYRVFNLEKTPEQWLRLRDEFYKGRGE